MGEATAVRRQLASRMSVSRSALARMEAGGAEATPAALRMAETALDLPTAAESSAPS